jgi:hypothetical protein
MKCVNCGRREAVVDRVLCQSCIDQWPGPPEGLQAMEIAFQKVFGVVPVKKEQK